jgi:hypothetical protein
MNKLLMIFIAAAIVMSTIAAAHSSTIERIDTYSVGSQLRTRVQFENQLSSSAKGSVTVFVPELGIWARNRYEADGRETLSKILLLQPENSLPDSFVIRVAVTSGNSRHVRYREYVKGDY